MRIRLAQKYEQMTLQQKVRMSILVVSMVPLICLACLLLLIIYRNQVGKMREDVYEGMQNRYGSMNYEMSTIELLANTVWSDTSFIAEVGKAALDGSLKEYDRYIFQEQTLAVLRVITSMGQVRGARLHLDCADMREYPSYLYKMDRAKNSRWYPDRYSIPPSGAWYMNVTEEESSGIYSSYYTSRNMASYVIRIRVNSAMEGIFEIMLPMESLIPDLYSKARTQDVFVFDSGRLIGVDEEGKFAGITGEELAHIMGSSSMEECDVQRTAVFSGWWKNMPVLLAVSRSGRNGMILMEITSIQEQYYLIFSQMLAIFLIEIIIIGLLSNAINRIVKRLLMDFDVFAGCIREVEKGNLDVKIPKLKQVEINEMAEEYGRMLQKVKQLMEDSIRREVLVKEAQLKSLEKQINSHFLYNVLDSIKMMAEVKEIYSVSDALVALGRMFRYNLSIDTHIVKFAEEISYLESYLNLCNIRFDYYINLSENIEESVRRLDVPKIILQPIAENSIQYGFGDQAEDTTIYLKAYVKEGCAYIEMSDMGRGMDEKKLSQVRQGILENGGFSGMHSTNGIGLHNIHERIQLLYGPSYGVTIYSKEGCYTKVVLKIRAEGVE